MNRLLQHFVADSAGGQGPPASRPPIPAPPQSSGSSYHGGNRGSFQRAAPGGPFYYQPQPSQTHGLEEVPLTSQSTGGVYETVDLNADSSQQHRSPTQQQQQQQRLFTPPPAGYRPPSAPNSQGRPLYKAATPPASRDAPFYQQKAPGSASDLFAAGPPPARELFGGPPSSGGGNPFRRSSSQPANGNGDAAMFGDNGHMTPPKDPFAANGAMFAQNTSQKDPLAAQNGSRLGAQRPQNDPFAAPRSGENRNVFNSSAPGASAQDPFAPKDAEVQQQQQQPTTTEMTANLFASAPSNASANPFASTASHSSSSPFEPPAPSNDGGHHSVASADSLFASPAPTYNGEWAQPTQCAQQTPSPVQAQELFASEAPSASSLFGGSAPSPFQTTPPLPRQPQANAPPSPFKPQTRVPPSPGKIQTGVPPSPAKSSVNVPSSPMKPPVPPPSPMVNASSPPMRPQVTVPGSPVMRPEDHLTPAFGSMKLTTAAKSPLKSGLDVRHMRFPAGRRDDDAMSNAPSIAPSRMSMLSTLDDSLKLSDMYKQMTARLEGEKHDLLKVVSSQAQEIAQMKKHIKSLELQLKKYRSQDA
ncbi:hypothetical protein PF005_g4806 [Phytophthora fragariae]|uniref:Uncharacterized protein n=1 Tax=Phytophthora fragariae TaxID=53985 RepID=A0A6A3Z1L4_9STRA|nr:hypothetical protein PF003_g19223 [Phytophthora fragariae]KAE8945129.1 hypothetical protein PF009_g5207 [Phytophthora fragariae]KAE9019711.1 hypothetical protein PF011_g5707 [Phytophthora fragariae]KAE9127070.1 hypothetical protein PF007_g5739 [Phytophthora fragariae]KAE9136820.1 hypothetical protein PF010_g1565 [Phytophthora fragariae]